MICPRCGSDRIRRAARRGLTEGILLRIAGRAPFRCFACGKRFVDDWSGQKWRKVGHHRSLANYIGLRRRQRFKLMLLALGALVVILAFGMLSWFSYQLATKPAPKRKKY